MTAQIDKFANINTTIVGGDYGHPKVRLPGASGAPEIAASCKEVIVVVRQSRRTLVEKVDFITSVGYGAGPGDRERLGLRGRGPQQIITDLGVLTPDPPARGAAWFPVVPDDNVAAHAAPQYAPLDPQSLATRRRCSLLLLLAPWQGGLRWSHLLALPPD